MAFADVFLEAVNQRLDLAQLERFVEAQAERGDDLVGGELRGHHRHHLVDARILRGGIADRLA